MKLLRRISENGKPPLRVSIKYILIQIPALIVFSSILLLIRLWLEIPKHVLWVFFGAWIVKDIVLFPFLWRSYDEKLSDNRLEMEGRKGFALTDLNPDGYVQINGERWRATNIYTVIPIKKNDILYVEARNGLRLEVRALSVESGPEE
jgi:membrane-bound ClpP family serine protease